MDKKLLIAEMDEAQELMHKLWAIGDKLNDMIESEEGDEDDLEGEFGVLFGSAVEMRDEVNNAGYGLELAIAEAEEVIK